jgi:hypothetical protein
MYGLRSRDKNNSDKALAGADMNIDNNEDLLDNDDVDNIMQALPRKVSRYNPDDRPLLGNHDWTVLDELSDPCDPRQEPCTTKGTGRLLVDPLTSKDQALAHAGSTTIAPALSFVLGGGTQHIHHYKDRTAKHGSLPSEIKVRAQLSNKQCH